MDALVPGLRLDSPELPLPAGWPEAERLPDQLVQVGAAAMLLHY